MTHCQCFFFLQVGQSQVARKFMIRPCEYSICQILRTRSTPTHMNCHVLCECYAMFCDLMHLSMVCPRMGGRATHGKFYIFSFQMSISPPLGLHFESNSHLWGELKGTHNSLYCSTERLQRKIITWGQNNGTHKLCVFPQVQKTYSGWIFSVAGNLTDMLSAILPRVPSNCFTQCLQQCKMRNTIPNKTCHHQEGLMVSKGWCFVPVVQNFI